MPVDLIRIRQAKQNNLVGVDIDLPRGKLIGITGVSGSGKSSLAFDTLFREGQRRFLETLSAYARQFLGRMEKPDVESISGLSPAIAVDQKSISRSARSTVGTLTEITDHLRVLFARAGTAHCPDCAKPVRSQTPEQIVKQVLRDYAGAKIHLLAPIVRARKGFHKAIFEDLQRKGFLRARVDGEVMRIEEVPELERYKMHTIEAVVDRLKPDAEDPSRLRESIEAALILAEGELVILGEDGETAYSTSRSCAGCGADVPPLEPRLFSFNSPHGACEVCNGLGVVRQPSVNALINSGELTIREGALAVTRASGGALIFPRASFEFLDRVAAANGFDLDTPWKDMDEEARKAILYGTGEERYEDHSKWSGKRYAGKARIQRKFIGVLPAVTRGQSKGPLQRIAKRYLDESVCDSCEGTRLRRAANAVRLGGLVLRDLTHCAVSNLGDMLDSMELTKREARIARDLLIEIRRRSTFLLSLGLNYLTLDRTADSLSGGEAQRIRLAAQLGAGLQGVLYVLDEPSIGLHWRDQGRLLGALRRLRDAGNTVVVVEHDETTLRAADFLIDVGPGAGSHGGRINAVGSPAKLSKLNTPTGRMLRGEIKMPAPETRRAGNGKAIVIHGARGYNLKGIDVSIPLGTLTCITGVSGSGKSTLVDRILRRSMQRHLGLESAHPVDHDYVEGLEAVDSLVCIDAAPIGRTPRSNPATYTGILSPIRDLFASLPESRMRGYLKGRFSFNTAGGRCEACQGAGALFVELQFLAPVTVPCEECGGHRFQTETLAVHYNGKNIAEVLAMTIEEAREFFRDHPKIARPLDLLNEIGLGYLTLGQPSTTLSGGEAQRIKLAKELSKRPREHTFYILDEPTTGLHMADVEKLVGALQQLVDKGHSVLVIEHNLELVWATDHVIDLGPEGGAGGGELVASGTPEEICKVKGSYTGVALKQVLEDRHGELEECNELEPVVPLNCIRVVEARTHNLKDLSVDIPRDSLTVITGRSGSGKSSLALDTIYTEGRRRFVESLSTYARQFLGTKDRPPVERIEGLGPSVAVEARTARGGPRSTIATTTEIHDHLRVLWARGGQPCCPDHGHKLEKSDASRLAARMLREHDGEGGWLLAPIAGVGESAASELQSEMSERVTAWRGAGYARLMIDGAEQRLDQDLPEFGEDAQVDLVVDRLKFDSKSKSRMAEAIEQAEQLSAGRISVILKDGRRFEYSTSGACPECGFRLQEEMEPRHFSFNTHIGACETCDGLGEVLHCDMELLIDEPDKPLRDGAIGGKLGRYLVKGKGFYELLLLEVARRHKIDLDKPFVKLTEKQQRLIAYGEGARKVYNMSQSKVGANMDIEQSFSSDWPGLCGHVDAWYAKAEDPGWRAVLEPVLRKQICKSCKGERLKAHWCAVTLGRKRLPEVLGLTVHDALQWLENLKLSKVLLDRIGQVLDELRSRTALLDRVGLGYLSLDRRTASLSTGEARRVRLSASLGSQLVGVCYVLDEPTVGLHPKDVDLLIDALIEMKNGGNTVLVVEHDTRLMERADWILDIGPGAGRFGGELVAEGTPSDIRANPKSLTGAALRGELAIVPYEGGETAVEVELAEIAPIVLRGAKTHNLRTVDLEIRYGEFLGLCGPSGSGKSSLLLETVLPAMEGESSEGRWKSIKGGDKEGRVVVVGATPIGRTPASTPATYCGLIDPLRELFAKTPEARMRGFTPSHFSFNSTRGRCKACEGRGATKVEMQFLPDLWLVCEECDGKRYRPEVLEVVHRGKTVADVLEMSAEEALEFFEHQPRIAKILQSLVDVGLGYLGLGQSSTTLSGGEAQRLKLASELLHVNAGGRSAIFLDEPTTGLHPADVQQLVFVLQRLVAAGNALVVIEHNTELLESCDRLVELGPEGGEAGGLVIAEGTPRELHEDKDSKTGPYLFQVVGALQPAPRKRASKKSARKKSTRKKVKK
ncbi:MAG: excinuclease ABC subunit A [Planctomycetota bacterium]|jgi:excinuclease ABC subunit A